MGKVSEYVLGLVRQRLGEQGPVVWFDPDLTFDSLISVLSTDGVPVFRYDGSFIKLRCEVEPHMGTFDPPKVVVYVPLDETDTHDALVELTASGVTLRPGHPSRASNTRLSVIARAALKDSVSEISLDAIVAKVEAGQLNLAELDSLAERGATDLSALALIYGTSQSVEITLRFLCDASKDKRLVTKGGVDELRRLVSDEYGISLATGDDVQQFRSRLGASLLVSDCVLSTEGVEELRQTFGAPDSPGLQASIRTVVGIWRNRQDLASSYESLANEAEKVLGTAHFPSSVEALAETETFATNDDQLQKAICSRLCDSVEPQLVELAARRQRGFWGRQPSFNGRWRLIVAAGEVLTECDRVEKALAPSLDATELVRRYADGPAAWCEVDTVQRQMERLFLELDEVSELPELERLVSRARHRYRDVANALSERFVSALEKQHFSIAVPRQRETFTSVVTPRLADARVAYFMVDAMRYEMGRELARLLDSDGTVDVSAAIGSVPTITEIGMASLLPKADGTVAIVNAGAGKLALDIGGVVVTNRKERMAFLQENCGVTSAILKLEDFPLKRSKRESIRDASLIVVTSQEIDMVGEADNGAFARQTMMQALDMLVRAVRALIREGVQQFVLTADHGHLFGEETLRDMTVESPKGDVADLHRRVWVGRGGASVPNTVRFKTKVFGLGGDYEIVTPRTLACFPAGGGNAFFHGGVSLQELVVPIVTLEAAAPARAKSNIEWVLTGSKRITTRIYTVRISGEASGLFDIDAPRVRIELLAAGKQVGKIQDADYGLERETGEISLRISDSGRSVEPDHVTFLLDEISNVKNIEVRLTDIRNETSPLKSERIEVAISL